MSGDLSGNPGGSFGLFWAVADIINNRDIRTRFNSFDIFYSIIIGLTGFLPERFTLGLPVFATCSGMSGEEKLFYLRTVFTG
jgi:hypothetical protein